MSLADLQRTIGQTIVNRLGVGTARLYHGTSPADCCPQPGQPLNVTVSWDSIHGSSDRPPSTAPVSDCAGPPIIAVRARLYSCWPTPTPPVDPGIFDPAAADLATWAWQGWQALRELICSTRPADLRDVYGVKAWWLISTTPVTPSGGCAGVEWKVSVQPNGSWPSA